MNRSVEIYNRVRFAKRRQIEQIWVSVGEENVQSANDVPKRATRWQVSRSNAMKVRPRETAGGGGRKSGSVLDEDGAFKEPYFFWKLKQDGDLLLMCFETTKPW